MKTPLVTLAASVGLASLASASDASAIAGAFTDGISGNDLLLWGIGAVCASVAVVTVVIKMILRNSKSVGNAA